MIQTNLMKKKLVKKEISKTSANKELSKWTLGVIELVTETDSSSKDDIEIGNAIINSNKAKTVNVASSINLGSSWDFHNVQLYTWKSYCWKG